MAGERRAGSSGRLSHESSSDGEVVRIRGIDPANSGGEKQALEDLVRRACVIQEALLAAYEEAKRAEKDQAEERARALQNLTDRFRGG